MKRDNLVKRAAQMGHMLEGLLRKEIGPLSLVGDIRGRGLFWDVEFVSSKEHKTPFSPKHDFCGKVIKCALDMGLNILGNLGRTGEYQVDHVLVCPPYITTDAELAEIVSLLKESILKASRPFLEVDQRGDIPNGKVHVKIEQVGFTEIR